MSVFSDFNKTVDLAQLKKDKEEAAKNGNSGNYEDVPAGKYEVKIEKLEPRMSKTNKPMLHIQFRILEGKYKNQCMFLNSVITLGFQIGRAEELLRSLDSDVDVTFEDYEQFEDVIKDVFEDISTKGLEYLVEHSIKNNFSEFKVLEVYGEE